MGRGKYGPGSPGRPPGFHALGVVGSERCLGDDLDETAHNRRGVVGAPRHAEHGGRDAAARHEGKSRAGVEGLRGCGAQADAAPSDHVLPPFVDRTGDGTDDGLVSAWPGIDEPVIAPAGGIAAVGGSRCCDPGQPRGIPEPELIPGGQRMAGGRTKTRGSSAIGRSSRPGARTGGRTKATSVLRSSSPAAGWQSSKVRTRTSTCVQARWNTPSRVVGNSPPAATLSPTDSRPPIACATLRAAATPRSSVASVARAPSRKALPAAVRATPRLVRSRSWTPSVSSSWRICELRTCWATCTLRAAAVKLASSATATK